MAFEWTEPIVEGDSFITKAVVDEIRTNLDSIKDAEACVADKGTYNAAQNVSDDGDHDTIQHNDENTGYKNNDDGTYNNDVNSGVQANDNTTYCDNENVSEDSGHNSDVDSGYDSGVLSIDNDTHRSAYYTSNRNINKNGVYYTQDAAEYTDFYMPHFASEYATFYGGVHSDHHYSV